MVQAFYILHFVFYILHFKKYKNYQITTLLICINW